MAAFSAAAYLYRALLARLGMEKAFPNLWPKLCTASATVLKRVSQENNLRMQKFMCLSLSQYRVRTQLDRSRDDPICSTCG